MNFAKFFKELIRGILLFTFSYALLGVFKVPSDTIYLIAVVIVFSLAILMHAKLLEFIAVRKAFPTRFIAIMLLVGIVIFVMEMLVPGFYVEGYVLPGTSSGAITIEATQLGKYATMALISAITGLTGSLMYTLESK